MTAANNNPYESPRVDTTTVVDSDLQSDRGKINKGMLATISFSGWAGILFGGMFGIGGSLMLGLSRWPLLGLKNLVLPQMQIFGVPTNGTVLDTGVIVVLLGAISGIACGVSIGPVVGILASAHSGRFRRVAFSSAVILSAIAGGGIGVMGSVLIILSQNSGDVSLASATVLGALIGSFSGLIGGLQLGRGILAFRD